MFIRFIIFTLLAVSCSTIDPSNQRSLASINKYDQIIAFGATTQGNGYNWAATVSWLAVKLADTAQQAKLAERRGEKVAIKIINFSGGSSGSGVTMLFDAFLSNKNILSSSNEAVSKRLLSPQDAERLSKALMFSAMSFDFSWFFKASSFARLVKRNITSILDQISDIMPIIPDFIGGGRRRLWKSKMTGKVVVADFAKFVNFAKKVTWEDVNEPIVWNTKEFKKFDLGSVDGADAKLIVKSLTHFYSLPLVDKPVKLSEKDLEVLREITKAQSKAARRVLNRVSGSNFKKFDKNGKLYRLYSAKPNTKKKKQSNPLKQTMAQPMSDGMMTITMAESFTNKKEMKSSIKKHGLAYKRLRPYVFMNESTAKQLINSYEYQRLVSEKDPIVSRYIITVVNQKWAGINPSVREPELLGELAGKMSGDNFRIQKVFDPKSQHASSFELIPIKNYQKQYLFVAGGFPYEQMTAIPSALYFIQEVAKLQKHHSKVFPTYHLYGHPLNREDPQASFAGRALHGIFNESGSEQEFQDSMKDWALWIRSWRKKFVTNLFVKYNILSIDTIFNWSTGSLPAALSGQSRILVQNSAVTSSKTNIVKKLHGIYSLYPPKDPKMEINQKPEK